MAARRTRVERSAEGVRVEIGAQRKPWKLSALGVAQLLFGEEMIEVSERELVLETATWPLRHRRRFDRDRIERLRSEPGGQDDRLLGGNV